MTAEGILLPQRPSWSHRGLIVVYEPATAWKSLEEPGRAWKGLTAGAEPMATPARQRVRNRNDDSRARLDTSFPPIQELVWFRRGETDRGGRAPRLLDFTSRAYLAHLAHLADFVVAAARPHWMAALAGSRHLEVWLSHSACHRSRMVAQSSVAPSAASSWSWVRRAAESPPERQWRRLHSLAGQSALVQCYGAPRAR